jgi:glycosyltransferase involved in cell wall biosynthesis
MAILDSNPGRWKCRVEGYIVERPDIIRKFQSVFLCITVADYAIIEEIRKMLQLQYQYNLEKEIHYNQLILELYRTSLIVKQYILGRKINADSSILFDCYNGLGLGGVEAWTMDLCTALIGSGKKDIYIISDNGIYDVPSALEMNILYTDIDHQERFSVDSVQNILDVILEKLPCKIVTSAVDEVMLAAHLVKLYYPGKVQIISVIHNSNEDDYEEYIDFRECSDCYIAVSRDIKADMIRKGTKEKRIDTMTCPFPCVAALERTYSIRSFMPLRIGYAGRIECYQKRMDLLIRLIELLLEMEIYFKMEIAGTGSVQKEMEEFVACNYLKDKVHFLGKLDRVRIPEFWKRQDICINLADFEGRSISVIEAMGGGAVPVVTATSGVREDIRDGVNGFIVPIGDYHAAADRIKLLDRRRELLPEMGKAAYDVVYPKSLMESHIEFWERIFIQKN